HASAFRVVKWAKGSNGGVSFFSNLYLKLSLSEPVGTYTALTMQVSHADTALEGMTETCGAQIAYQRSIAPYRFRSEHKRLGMGDGQLNEPAARNLRTQRL